MPKTSKLSNEEVEARIARLEEELGALKATYFNVALDELRRPQGLFNVLTFTAGGKMGAVPLWAVAGVSWAVATAPDAKLLPPFVGLVNYHGELVPVIDTAALLGEERRAMTTHDQIIYVAAAGRKLGLMVGASLDVEILDGSKLALAGEAGLSRHLFLGVYERGGEVVRIFEPTLLVGGVAARAERPGDESPAVTARGGE